MGSVIDFIDCPTCKGKQTMYDEFWYKTGQELQMCEKCGASRSNFILRDDEGRFKLNEAGDVIWEYKECMRPHATVTIHEYGMVSNGVMIMETLSEYKSFQSKVFKELKRKGHNIETIKVSRFNGKVLLTKYLVKNGKGK